MGKGRDKRKKAKAKKAGMKGVHVAHMIIDDPSYGTVVLPSDTKLCDEVKRAS